MSALSTHLLELGKTRTHDESLRWAYALHHLRITKAIAQPNDYHYIFLLERMCMHVFRLRGRLEGVKEEEEEAASWSGEWSKFRREDATVTCA